MAFCINKTEEFDKTPQLVETLAVSNDGRWLAMWRQAFELIDVEKGTFKARTLKTEKMISSNDVRMLSFSEDGSLLFSVLRDGRVVCRDTTTWKVKPWAKGVEKSARDLQISGDGEFITGSTSKGPFLWTKDAEKSKPLKVGAKVRGGFRWSGRPEFEHYSTAVSHLEAIGQDHSNDDPNAGEALSSSMGSIEVRRYEKPDAVWKRLEDKEQVLLNSVEALGVNHVAATILRRPTKQEKTYTGDNHEWGLRIWNIPRQEIVGEAFLPSHILSMAASDDGRILATVGERRHVVYLWRINPKGTIDRKYPRPVEWAEPPPLQWKAQETDAEPAMTLQEKGNGEWTLKGESRTLQLKEKARNLFGIILAGQNEDHYFFNTGVYWTLRAGPNRDIFAGQPNIVGYDGDRLFRKRDRTWKLVRQGYWYGVDLPPRFPPAELDKEGKKN